MSVLARLEVVGTRKNRRARRRHARGRGSFLTPRVSPSREPVLSFTHYFQAPATQAMSVFTFDIDTAKLYVQFFRLLA